MATDHHEFDCYATNPAEDMIIAQSAFDQGDLDHAAHHIACAMSVDPNAKYAAFLERLMEVAPDPLELAPLEGHTFFGTVAVRAYILRRLGQHLEAIDLLLQVIGVRPDVPYSNWLEAWLEDDEVLASVDPDAFAVAVQRCLEQIDATELGWQCAPTLVPQLIAAICRVRERHQVHGPLALIHSRAARRINDLATALSVAEDHHRLVPGYLSAVALAGAHRARGDLPRAVELFREALGHSCEDLAVRLDIGDVCLEMDHLDEALAAYQEVLEREPGQRWAAPSALYTRFLRTGDPALRDELEQLAFDIQEQDLPNDRALTLLDAISPYVGYLPDRQESIINALRHGIDQGSTPTTLTLSSLEAPSAVASVVTALGELGQSPIIEVGEVPWPDPRLSRGEALYQLWKYEGRRARPNMAPPDEETAEAILSIARTPYHLDDWTDRARALARELGFVALEPLLGVMVHPPPRPPETSPWTWTFAVQVATALTLAFIDEGWEESIRRRALQSLVNGPVDWTTTAGVLALTALGCSETELAPEITVLFEELLQAPTSPIWRACVQEPLVHCMLLLPGLPSRRRQALRELRTELEQRG